MRYLRSGDGPPILPVPERLESRRRRLAGRQYGRVIWAVESAAAVTRPG